MPRAIAGSAAADAGRSGGRLTNDTVSRARIDSPAIVMIAASSPPSRT